MGAQVTENAGQVYLTVILPAYNEERKIGVALKDLVTYLEGKGFTYEIIVSADGTDRTREIASELARQNPRIVVVGSPRRRGKGLAVKEAVLMSRGQYVGYMDADNKTPACELEKFLKELENGAPVVIGSRALSGALTSRDRPLFRRIFSWAYRVFTHLVVGLWDIDDTQCGFKFFSRPVALELFSQQRILGYAFDVEILYLARKRGYRIVQLPISFRHDPDSRMSVIVGNLRSLRDTILIRFYHH